MAGAWLHQHEGHESWLELDELRAKASAGEVRPGDLVYHPVQGAWSYARELAELRDVLIAPGGLVPLRPPNDSAIAGFTLGVLAIAPFLGLVCAVIGLPLSLHGLLRSRSAGSAPGVDRRFAIVGVALSGFSLLVHAAGFLLLVGGG